LALGMIIPIIFGPSQPVLLHLLDVKYYNILERFPRG
jgi:hypothetical protein